MEENSQDEDSSLRDYWLKRKEGKKESKKKQEKKKMKDKSKGKEEAGSADHESQGAHKRTLFNPTKLTPLTSRNESSLGNLIQDGIQTALQSIWKNRLPHPLKSTYPWHFKTMITRAYSCQTLKH